MKLQIERNHVDALVDQFPDLAGLKAQLKLGGRAEVPFHEFSADQLRFLRARYEAAGNHMAGRAAQLH